MQTDVVCKQPWATPPAQGSPEWMAETQEKLFNTLALLHKKGSLSVENVNAFSRVINISVLNDFDQIKQKSPELILLWILDIIRSRASPAFPPSRCMTLSPSILSLKAPSSFISPTLLPARAPSNSSTLNELSPTRMGNNSNSNNSHNNSSSGNGSSNNNNNNSNSSTIGSKKGSLKQLSPSVRQMNKSLIADDTHQHFSDPCLSPSASTTHVSSSPIPISGSSVTSWSSSLVSSSPGSDPFFTTAPSAPSSLLVSTNTLYERVASASASSPLATSKAPSFSSPSSISTTFHSSRSTFSLRNLFSFTNSSPITSHPSNSSEDDTDSGSNSKTKFAKKVTPTIHLPRNASVEKERRDEVCTAYENRQLSPENLIRVLLSPDHEQVDFRCVYMLSFRSFTSPSELLSRVFFYYDHPSEVVEEHEISEIIAQTVRLKVISFLNYWLKNFFPDFTPELRESLHMHIGERLKVDPDCRSLITLHIVLQRLEGTRRDSVEKEGNGSGEDKKDKEGSEEGERSDGGLRPRSGPSGVSSTASYISSTSSVFNRGGPSSCSSTGSRSPANSSKGLRRSRSLDVLEVSPRDLARELTLLDFELFKRIMPLELTDQSWKRQPEKSANVVAFIQAFNDRAQWVAGELLARTKINERTTMKEKFIDTAFECLKLENFHTTFAIMAAMTQHAVHRLKDLQGALGPPHERIAEQLRTLTSSSDNYKTYRAIFKSALQNNRTCLPHLGVTLKNLTLYQASTPYEQQHKVIDINRLVLVASEITHIEECTKRDYIFSPDPELRRKVRRALEKFAGKTDDELIARSMALEPRMTWQQYNQKVCLDVLHEEGFL